MALKPKLVVVDENAADDQAATAPKTEDGGGAVDVAHQQSPSPITQLVVPQTNATTAGASPEGADDNDGASYVDYTEQNVMDDGEYDDDDDESSVSMNDLLSEFLFSRLK